MWSLQAHSRAAGDGWDACGESLGDATAVSQALVGLSPLLGGPGAPPIELKQNVREKKNWGGLDSIGRVIGSACRE